MIYRYLFERVGAEKIVRAAVIGTGNYATAIVTQSVLDGEFEAVHHDDSGQVTVSNSRLVHGAVSGTVTCVAVSRDNTFNANGCP